MFNKKENITKGIFIDKENIENVGKIFYSFTNQSSWNYCDTTKWVLTESKIQFRRSFKMRNIHE